MSILSEGSGRRASVRDAMFKALTSTWRRVARQNANLNQARALDGSYGSGVYRSGSVVLVISSRHKQI